MQRTNLFSLDRQGLVEFFAGLGEKPFRATQVMKWIYQRGVTDFSAMTDLSKGLRSRLEEVAELRVPELVMDQDSDDGTHKWLLRLEGGNCIEAVLIPEPGRRTLCVSSQVGCALYCSFCATARQGFNRNLDTAEIIGQLWQASHRHAAGRITNVVFMGMGEPLLNLDHVVRACNIMMDDYAFGLSKRRVTISTSGVVPALDRLAAVSDVSLAVSLHAANDELRSRLIPLNRNHPIADLLAACRRYLAGQPHRRITWEYVMLDGVNDSDADARQLARLLSDIPSKVNLIPFNPFPGSGYQCSPWRRIDRFRDILLAHGLVTITRRTRGDDIDAACGQLAGRVQDRSRRPQRIARLQARQ